MKHNETQLQQIKSYLRVHKKITSWKAIELYRITRLPEYIRILRKLGWDIEMERIHPKGGNWYGQYTYIPEDQKKRAIELYKELTCSSK